MLVNIVNKTVARRKIVKRITPHWNASDNYLYASYGTKWKENKKLLHLHECEMRCINRMLDILSKYN